MPSPNLTHPSSRQKQKSKKEKKEEKYSPSSRRDVIGQP